MRRVFVGNFDFEQRLASPGLQSSARLARWCAELASIWLAIADDGDLIWTPEAIADDFWTACATNGLPEVTGVRDWRSVSNAEIVPWGWSGELIPCSSNSAPHMAAMLQANDRRLSASLEVQWQVAPPGLVHCRTVEDVHRALNRPEGQRAGWVLKAALGTAGREQLRVRGALSEPQRHWVTKRLVNQCVVVEPWLDAIEEVGVQWDVPRHGAPQLIGVAPMLPMPGGHYAGSWIRRPHHPQGEWWKPAIEVTEHAAVEVQRLGYFGPLGIDMMLYRDEVGEQRVRPLQDINARWTMGRLALGWQSRFPQRDGYWWHATRGDGDVVMSKMVGLADSVYSAKVIATSPDVVGGTPAHLRRELVLWKSVVDRA